MLSTRTLNKTGRATGFIKRNGGKITPSGFVTGFIIMASKGKNTFSKWAEETGKLTNKTISKQALWEKLTTSAREFSEQTLKEALKKKYTSLTKGTQTLFSCFVSVLLQDSTTLRLPDELAVEYAGNRNQKDKRRSIARIDTIFDLKENRFCQFLLRQFTDNDQSASAEVLTCVKKSTLVIRDLGYFSLQALKQIAKTDAFFLTRKPYQVSLYDGQINRPIDLVKELGKKGMLDKEVLVGKDKELKARLVALPLPRQVAESRRRKAKNDRDKRLNHSKEYYFLLGYIIYLTNVGKETWSSQDIANVYRLRWRIEIIFKCWKSCFNIDKLIHRQCADKNRVECIIYLMLLYMVLFQAGWYEYFHGRIFAKNGKHLSLLKFANFINSNIEIILNDGITLRQFEKQILKHCLYETRKDRINSMEYAYSMAA